MVPCDIQAFRSSHGRLDEEAEKAIVPKERMNFFVGLNPRRSGVMTGRLAVEMPMPGSTKVHIPAFTAVPGRKKKFNFLFKTPTKT